MTHEEMKKLVMAKWNSIKLETETFIYIEMVCDEPYLTLWHVCYLTANKNILRASFNVDKEEKTVTLHKVKIAEF